MPAQIINGKEIAAGVRREIKAEADRLKKSGIIPGLCVVMVGDDPASKTYVANKKKASAEAGFYSTVCELPASAGEEELLGLVGEMNRREDVHGILVQLPLPAHIDANQVINAIDPQKDVDAFHPVNVGKIMIGDFDFVPCTPAGVMVLLEESGVSVAGKECVVVGRSNIVGKPQAMLLMHRHGTVTVCHSRTRDLKEVTRRADILVAAIGRAKMITADMVKPGAVVVDVGMNRDGEGRLCGDVDFESVKEVASYITPVPGGVGPMTIAMLMQNTLKAAKLANGI